MRGARFFALTFVLLACALAAAAGDVTSQPAPGFSVSSRVDWVSGEVRVEISRALDPETPSLPRAKGDAEAEIESRLGAILVEALSPLLVDSSHTFGDLLGQEARLFAAVNSLALSAPRRAVFLTEDFSALVARYAIPLFGEGGVVGPLIPATATPIRRRPGYVASRKFTGLVIYVPARVAAVGSTREAAPRPALFPRIFDEEMSLVMEKSMCGPDSLARWGMVGYAKTLDDPAVMRAGAAPLRVVARAVFGDHATDLVIPTEGARQLLSVAENLAILREGRIVLVCEGLE